MGIGDWIAVITLVGGAVVWLGRQAWQFWRRHKAADRLALDASIAAKATTERRLSVEAARLTPMLVKLSLAYDAEDRSRVITVMLDVERKGFGVIFPQPAGDPAAVDLNRLHSIRDCEFIDLHAPPGILRLTAETVLFWSSEAGDLPLTLAVCDNADVNTPLFTVTRSVAVHA